MKAASLCIVVTAALGATIQSVASTKCSTQATHTVEVSPIEFEKISADFSSSKFGAKWVDLYGGIVLSHDSVRPYALIGGAWGRERIDIRKSGTDEVIQGVPVDLGFMRDHWSAASAAAGPTWGGRFGWTFGVSVGSLKKSSGSADDTDNSTNYFLGVTYRINPQMTLSLGYNSFQGQGRTNGSVAFGVSIDPSTISSIFGGR